MILRSWLTRDLVFVDGYSHHAVPQETVPKWFDRKVLDSRARFVGDMIGVAVAADTREIADEAIRLMDIKWEVEKPFLEVDEAESQWAVPLHPEANSSGNQLPHREDLDGGPCVDDIVVDKGDVDKGFAEADAVVEVDETFGGNSTQGTLDFRGCMSEWVDDRIEVWTNHYYSDQVRMHLHDMLGLPLAKIRVHNTNCGAHMGKWNMGEQNFFLLSAILSRRTGCPVKYKMNVHEEFAETRTKIRFKLKAGAKKDGTITALYFDGIGNQGGLQRRYGICSYRIHECRGHTETVLSCRERKDEEQELLHEQDTGRSFQECGKRSAEFPSGQAVDALAEKLGIDPITIYKKSFGNSYDPQPNASVAAVLDAAAEEFGWSRRHKTVKDRFWTAAKRGGWE